MMQQAYHDSICEEVDRMVERTVARYRRWRRKQSLSYQLVPRRWRAAYYRRWRSEDVRRYVRAYQNGVITRVELYLYFWTGSATPSFLRPFVRWYWWRERQKQDRRY